MSHPLSILLVFLCFINISLAQGVFEIDANKQSFEMDFEKVNDLVIVPVEVNGVELNFLLDTGVDSSIIFSLEEKDSLSVKNATEIKLKGWGEKEAMTAFRSTGNSIRIGKASNNNFTIYIVYDHQISLSNRLGFPVHGIIGYDFFKDFVVEFNYSKEELIAFNTNTYTYKKCKRCEDLDLIFSNNKPYIEAQISVGGEKPKSMTFLIDSGSGDALWIFEDPSQDIKVPENYFEDFLGFGMGGSVYGKRARVKTMTLGRFNFEAVTASFPDTLYFEGITTFKSRNGTLGSQILKRFTSTFDYRNKRLRLKPNNVFNEPFEYDMSGIILAHNGYTIVKDFENNDSPVYQDKGDGYQGVVVYKSYSKVKFRLEPQYKIVEVRPNSPAEMAGLKVNDVVEMINSKMAFKYELSDINKLFSSGEGKTIRLKVNRNGVVLNIAFKLKKVL